MPRSGRTVRMTSLAASAAYILLIMIVQNEAYTPKSGGRSSTARFQSMDQVDSSVANLDKMLDSVDAYRKDQFVTAHVQQSAVKM
jgi:hypothetical protein